MAWNPSPKIADCRDISRKWKYDQIIVVALNSKTGIFETVSYGETRKLCDDAKHVSKQIHDRIESGSIVTEV